jgi:hypothetical protein
VEGHAPAPPAGGVGLGVALTERLRALALQRRERGERGEGRGEGRSVRGSGHTHTRERVVTVGPPWSRAGTGQHARSPAPCEQRRDSRQQQGQGRTAQGPPSRDNRKTTAAAAMQGRRSAARINQEGGPRPCTGLRGAAARRRAAVRKRDRESSGMQCLRATTRRAQQSPGPQRSLHAAPHPHPCSRCIHKPRRRADRAQQSRALSARHGQHRNGSERKRRRRKCLEPRPRAPLVPGSTLRGQKAVYPRTILQ